MESIGANQCGSDFDIFGNRIVYNGETGFALYKHSGTANILDNTIINNTSSITKVGGIGVSLSNSSSEITITNNLIDNNVGSIGGIGIKDSSGTYYVGLNTLTNNDSGIGISGLANNFANIYSNIINYQDRSGISISFSNNVSIQNNIILSNGWNSGPPVGGLYDASGIRARDSQWALVELLRRRRLL
jgi:hypothetical protein